MHYFYRVLTIVMHNRAYTVRLGTIKNLFNIDIKYHLQVFIIRYCVRLDVADYVDARPPTRLAMRHKQQLIGRALSRGYISRLICVKSDAQSITTSLSWGDVAGANDGLHTV